MEDRLLGLTASGTGLLKEEVSVSTVQIPQAAVGIAMESVYVSIVRNIMQYSKSLCFTAKQSGQTFYCIILVKFLS